MSPTLLGTTGTESHDDCMPFDIAANGGVDPYRTVNQRRPAA